MPREKWFTAIAKHLGEAITQIVAHGVAIVALVLCELIVLYLLEFGPLKHANPEIKAFLAGVPIVTLSIFTLHFLYVQTLSAWEDIRDRLGALTVPRSQAILIGFLMISCVVVSHWAHRKFSLLPESVSSTTKTVPFRFSRTQISPQHG
jgi:hypothetical protein